MRRRTLFKKAMQGVGLASVGLARAGIAEAIPQAAGAAGNRAENESARAIGGSYRRIKSYLDSIPAVDLHEHLRAFNQLVAHVEKGSSHGPGLDGIWGTSYLSRIAKLTRWNDDAPFAEWWSKAQNDFVNFRTTGFYRYLWVALRDLYGVDFDHITEAQAAALDRSIRQNYRDDRWLRQVILEKSNIACILCNRWWDVFKFRADYPFELLAFHVNQLVVGHHSSVFQPSTHQPPIAPELLDPFVFAHQRGLPMNTLDDYLAMLDHALAEAKAGDCVAMKCSLAYNRSLHFEKVSKQRAERAFGRSRSEVTAEQAKDFEDYVMWRLAELSARHELPLQIHTGDADLRNSNPTLLLDLIDANPHTRFELFHGGIPWVREYGMIGNKYPRNVWLNCTWLPTFGKRVSVNAFGEWLDLVPSNRINWGGDDETAEGIYGAAELNRQCWAEALAVRVDSGDLDEPEARRIGKQILRDNALELYPRFLEKLGKA